MDEPDNDSVSSNSLTFSTDSDSNEDINEFVKKQCCSKALLNEQDESGTVRKKTRTVRFADEDNELMELQDD